MSRAPIFVRHRQQLSALLDSAIRKLYGYVDQRIDSVRPFRAVVTGQSNGMVQIKRLTDSGTGETVLNARVAGFDLATDDEVLVIQIPDWPSLGARSSYVVLGPLQRATPTSYTAAALKAPGVPTYLAPTVSDTAVTGSNTSNTAYEVNVTQSVVLPATGTYTVYAEAGGCFAHSDANGSVRIHLQVGSDAGTARIVACAQTTGRSELTIANHATGQSGTITVALEYRPNSSGKTAYAGGGWIQVWYVRE